MIAKHRSESWLVNVWESLLEWIASWYEPVTDYPSSVQPRRRKHHHHHKKDEPGRPGKPTHPIHPPHPDKPGKPPGKP